MPVRDTSKLAKNQIEKEGTAGTQRLYLLNLIYCMPGMTRKELSEHSQVAINAVCGRVNELIHNGDVEEIEKRKCKITGRKAWTLQIRDLMAEVPF